MKGVLYFWVSLLIVFGMAQIGTEIYKAYEQKQMIEREIFSIAMDAMELAMLDSFRMEHVSFCDTHEAEMIFKTSIQNRFNLNDQSEVISSKNSCVTRIETVSLETFAGAYEQQYEFYEQKDLPFIAYNGRITMNLQVLKFKKKVEIPISMKIIAHRV